MAGFAMRDRRYLAPNSKIELLLKSIEIFDRLRTLLINSKANFTSISLINILFRLSETL